MDEMKDLQELATAVQALFVAQRGAWQPDEFVTVAAMLGFRVTAETDLPLAARPWAANYFTDLVGTNLAHALGTYDWGDWRPLTDDGVTIAGFWQGDGREERPVGYVLEGNGRYLRRG